MLQSLTLAQKISKQSKAQLTLSDINNAFRAQVIPWERVVFAFRPEGSYGRSIKSLKTVAKENAFLQPFYQQRVCDAAASQATGGQQAGWKIQNFAEAIAHKNQKVVIYPLIEWSLAAIEPDLEGTLRAIDTVLAEYSQKNYQYKFEAQFLGLNFGNETLAQLPGHYASGRGPFVAEGMNELVRGVKWAFSQTRFTVDRFGATVVIHCLLDEAKQAGGEKLELPEAFARLASYLFEFRTKDVMRRLIRSPQESDDQADNSPATRTDLPQSENLPVDRKRLEQLVEDAVREAYQHLDSLMATGKLPHRLERYYFPEGVLRPVGQNESGRLIMESFPNPDPAQTSYAAYHQIWVPEDQALPPSLLALGYDRESARPHFEQQRQFFLAAYQNQAHAMGHFKKTVIDGVECTILTTDRERFNRRKILSAHFKPLGYEFVKQSHATSGSYELRKTFSDTEVLRCYFDFGSWRQTIECLFAYERNDFSAKLNAFRMRLTGWSRPASIDISSEELFERTVENISAMVHIIETDHIPGLRHRLQASRRD
jgi:hypothetical protein